MSESAQPNIMMIGPTRAGKTTLLKVLRLASRRALPDGSHIEVEPMNSLASELFDDGGMIVETGNFSRVGTIGVVEYKIRLTCSVEGEVWVDNFIDEQVPGFWNAVQGKTVKVNRPILEKRMIERKMSLTVLDGRGGDVFTSNDRTNSNDKTKGMDDEPKPESKREALIELATKSESLIICISACDADTTKVFFRDLQRFLDEVKQRGNVVPFKRVAVAVTHADRLVEAFGSSAQAELAKRCPANEASEAIGHFAKMALFQSLQNEFRSHVYAGWSSVYGFINREGSVNFDPENNRVAIFDARGKWTKDWYPFGVVEPFLFACTGKVVNMVQMTEG